VRLYRLLGDDDRATVEDNLRIIVAEKNWEGCGGLTITDEMQVVIAAQAALMILNIPHDYFCGVQSILVYPTTFLVPGRRSGAGGIVDGAARPVLGLASLQGPVILAWDSVTAGVDNPDDGRNVVIHEFAHKLDMLDRFADGAPPLHSREQYEAWKRIMTDEYAELVERAGSGKPTLLRKYGATNPAEFFAVAGEAFFERSRTMQRRHPELYGLLASYFRQDPAAWPGRTGAA